MSASDESNKGGIIGWMVTNKVTANLLMVFLLGGGIFMSTRIKQEVFPEFTMDQVNVSVAYPGASPEEVERAIVLPIEEALRGLSAIQDMTSTANEGSGSIRLELVVGADGPRVRQDVQQAVDRIRTFPGDVEEPRISLAERRRQVVTIQLFGDVPEATLRELAEQTRDGLLQHDGITQVDISGARDVEIHIDVTQDALRAHGLSLDAIAQRIRAASIELPGGAVDTQGGEVLLRVTDRRDWARDFHAIPIQTTASGTVIRLGDISEISEGFADINRVQTYNGDPSISLLVYRVGEETPLGISAAVREQMEDLEAGLPAAVSWEINSDRSTIYKQRLRLLLKNMFLGLVLVLVLLGLFLELRVAFWVTMGIPISFLGAMLFLPIFDVSINMISMFAFIVALGIVVDDAIVAGENIYEYRSRGMSPVQAAIKGAKDVSGPIGFSILTNIVAFMPLYFVPGFMGKIWRVIPMVVITVFIISWVESLLILPEHLAHVRERNHRPGPIGRFQQYFNRGVTTFAERVYAPVLGLFLRWRIVTLAVAAAALIVSVNYVRGGHIGMILMPRVESDTAVVGASLPAGSTMADAERVRDRITEALGVVVAANGGEDLLKGTRTTIDENSVEVLAYLTDPNVRPMGTREMTMEWRRAVGPVAGVEKIGFVFDRGGPGSGAGLTVELSHRDVATLERAAQALAAILEEFSNTTDVDDGRSDGKQQLDFRLSPGGESLGVSSVDIARQVRSSFFGSEAQRQLRGSDEVRVLVRLPESERSSEGDIETLLISTPGGRFVPLREVATIDRGRSFTSIRRRDARRTVSVTANVEPIGETGQVMAALEGGILEQLAADYPGLSAEFRGRQFDMRESTGALFRGFLMALVCMYFLLAIPFRSYLQPIVVMTAIPFGIVGAVIGHIVMGYQLSLMSMMGFVALSGVLVNDSLLLVDYANRRKLEGVDARKAIREAGVRRFRPVLLTTLTTFGGLAPMIFETSRQARFMIPMALSLGFGILFATAITLILVPALYTTIEDVRSLWRTLVGTLFSGRARGPEST